MKPYNVSDIANIKQKPDLVYRSITSLLLLSAVSFRVNPASSFGGSHRCHRSDVDVQLTPSQSLAVELLPASTLHRRRRCHVSAGAVPYSLVFDSIQPHSDGRQRSSARPTSVAVLLGVSPLSTRPSFAVTIVTAYKLLSRIRRSSVHEIIS